MKHSGASSFQWPEAGGNNWATCNSEARVSTYYPSNPPLFPRKGVEECEGGEGFSADTYESLAAQLSRSDRILHLQRFMSCRSQNVGKLRSVLDDALHKVAARFRPLGKQRHIGKGLA